MSKLLTRLFVLIFSLEAFILYGQKTTCGNELKYRDAASKTKINEANIRIANFLSNSKEKNKFEIEIPVVVHIVWQSFDENISDELVYSQIDAINRDFNAQNSDNEKIPFEFNPAIGDAGIHFCLAQTDPKGHPSNGIIRVKTNILEIGVANNLFYSSKGGSSAWDTEKYLNIWVANTGKKVLGLGSYPNTGNPAETGIVVHPKYFGINGENRYGVGRVATHELGHYFGLKHLWADDSDCKTDDEIIDTPPQTGPHYGCPTYPQSGCSESEMFMNFMDYVDDRCMLMFTEGQVEWMHASIKLYRNGLLENKVSSCNFFNDAENDHLVIYPNPSGDIFFCRFSIPPKKIISYTVYNFLGEKIFFEKKFVTEELIINLSNNTPGVYFLSIKNRAYKLILYK